MMSKQNVYKRDRVGREGKTVFVRRCGSHAHPRQPSDVNPGQTDTLAREGAGLANARRYTSVLRERSKNLFRYVIYLMGVAV